MKTATFFCFVGAFLSTPTLGMIWFVAEDPAKTDEFVQSDLRTLLHLIRAELAAGRRVTIAAPPTVFSSPLGTDFDFITRWSDPNNNWIDTETGLPFNYTIDGRLLNTEFDQELIHVVSLETGEKWDGNEWSLILNLTVRIENMAMYSFLSCNGTWRIYNLNIEQAVFASFFPNVEIRYEARFHLGQGERLQRSTGQSVMTVNRMTVGFIGVGNQDEQSLFYWERDQQPDGEHVDDVFRSVFSEAIPYASDAIDSLVSESLGSRPYIVPQITLATAAANVSGFSCRGHLPRRKRETKLRVQPIDDGGYLTFASLFHSNPDPTHSGVV